MERRAKLNLINLLEGVERAELGNGARTSDAIETAGVDQNMGHVALGMLHELQCIAWFQGVAYMTERGKIALAIHRGKMRWKETARIKRS